MPIGGGLACVYSPLEKLARTEWYKHLLFRLQGEIFTLISHLIYSIHRCLLALPGRHDMNDSGVGYMVKRPARNVIVHSTGKSVDRTRFAKFGSKIGAVPPKGGRTESAPDRALLKS